MTRSPAADRPEESPWAAVDFDGMPRHSSQPESTGIALATAVATRLSPQSAGLGRDLAAAVASHFHVVCEEHLEPGEVALLGCDEELSGQLVALFSCRLEAGPAFGDVDERPSPLRRRSPSGDSRTVRRRRCQTPAIAGSSSENMGKCFTFWVSRSAPWTSAVAAIR
jgi:hypothetical protein